MSSREFAAPPKRRPGRPPLSKGKGSHPTYVPSNANASGNNNNNNNSPIQTPPRSPSEASLASNRDIASDGVLSPLNSPVILPPVPEPQRLPNSPQPRAPLAPLAAPVAPTAPPPAAKQPQQPQVADNLALPPGQDVNQLRQRIDNIAESNRRHNIVLNENSSAIRQMREQINETNRLLNRLLDRADANANTNSNEGVRSASGSRSDYSNENNTNVRPPNNNGLNAQNRQDSEVRRVLEDKHIPPAITLIKSPVSHDIVRWIEKLQSIARHQRWSDADIRQVFLFRTAGQLNDFLLNELDISSLTFPEIVNAIFQKWNNIDRLVINTQRLQNLRRIFGKIKGNI